MGHGDIVSKVQLIAKAQKASGIPKQLNTTAKDSYSLFRLDRMFGKTLIVI